jgi:hypothetical protein
MGKRRVNGDVGYIQNVQVGGTDDVDLDGEGRCGKVQTTNLELFYTQVIGTYVF